MNLDDLIRNTKEGLPVSPQDAARHKKRLKANKFFDMTQEVKGEGTLGGKKLSNKERIQGFKAARGGADSVDWKTFLNQVENRKEEAEVGKSTKLLPEGDKASVLQTIATDVKSILGIIDARTEAEEDAADELKQEDEKDKRKKKEEDKEKDAKKGMKIPGFIQKAAAPVTNLWGSIVKTFGLLLAGWGIDKIFKWLKDPKNKEAVENLKEFITVTVPPFLKGILALAALGIGIKIAKFAIMLAKGTATLLVGLKNLAGTIKAMVMKNPKLALALGITALAAYGISKMSGSDKDREDELEGMENAQEDLKLYTSNQEGDQKVEMNGGGVVPHLKMAGGGVVPHLKMAGGGLVQHFNEGGNVSEPEMSRRQQIMMQTDVTGSLEDGNYSARVFEATPEQRHASYKEMGMPSMELWDGSVVPNFGKMGADQMDDGLDMVREGLTDPAKIKEFDEFRATNPFAKPEKIENMINRLVPGSTEQVMGDLGDDISAKAKEESGFNMGGLVRPKRFNKGGKVSGSGNKDTVPAMLTPGEFVMSKGAVEKYGTSTLASMNAMGGGNNTPKIGGTIQGFNQGGIVGKIRGLGKKVMKTATQLINNVPVAAGANVTVLPVPSGGGGNSGGSSGVNEDNDIELFSPLNGEDLQTLIVKNMYSILD